MKKSSQTSRGRTPASVEGASFSATEAQNNFGRVLDRAASDGVVYITKHRRRQAVVLSVERYEALTRVARPDLEALTREFDGMMDRMQSPRAAAGYDALFSASPKALGEAAVRGARGGVMQPEPAATATGASGSEPLNRHPKKASSARNPGGTAKAASQGAKRGPGSSGVQKSESRRKRA